VKAKRGDAVEEAVTPDAPPPYEPLLAKPTERIEQMLSFRAVNPLYGVFLLEYLGQMEPLERLQILESLLELPMGVAARVRPPRHEQMPPSDAVQTLVDTPLIQAGLFTPEELYPKPPYEQDLAFGEMPRFPIPLAEKMKLCFRSRVSVTGPLPIVPAFAAGELFNLDDDFKTLIQTRELGHQEGLVFRHLLRLILLCQEFRAVRPIGLDPDVWHAELDGWSERLTQVCLAVDPQSTDEVL
jgi:hypothetical protein